MNKICARIYYLITTGEVLLIIPEMQSTVSPNTKEQDMETYSQLKDKSSNDVNYIELEYGTFSSTFENIKSYVVNISTETLNCIYYTQAEIDAQNNVITNDSRITDIANYLISNNDLISVVENCIIQSELNTI